MTQVRLLTDLTIAAMVAAFTASVFFVAAYTILARWWRSPIARALCMLDTGLALTLAPSVLHWLLGFRVSDSTGFGWYFLASLTLVAAAVIWRTLIMVGEQVRRRRDTPPGTPQRDIAGGSASGRI